MLPKSPQIKAFLRNGKPLQERVEQVSSRVRSAVLGLPEQQQGLIAQMLSACALPQLPAGQLQA